MFSGGHLGFQKIAQSANFSQPGQYSTENHRGCESTKKNIHL